jgi:hypothetical protein
VRTLGGERVQAVPGTPGQVAAQVGLGVFAGGALEAGEVGSYGSRSRSADGARGSKGTEDSSVKCIMP